MGENPRDERLERLEPFVGEWRLEAPAFPLPSELADEARTSFEWALGGAFLLQRSFVPVPEAPSGLCVIAPALDAGYTQHYFDSRGVVRIYALTFDGREWALERHVPDFSPLDFHQRWSSTFGADGNTIEGRWETSPDGRRWQLDFELAYHRLSAGSTGVGNREGR
jgi:hypothetical protein